MGGGKGSRPAGGRDGPGRAACVHVGAGEEGPGLNRGV